MTPDIARRWVVVRICPMVRAAVREVSVPNPDMDAFCGRLDDIAEFCDDLREAIEEGGDASPWETE